MMCKHDENELDSSVTNTHQGDRWLTFIQMQIFILTLTKTLVCIIIMQYIIRSFDVE